MLVDVSADRRVQPAHVEYAFDASLREESHQDQA